MNLERLERLTQDELDGTASPRESEELRALLSASEEARLRHEEIRNVFQILEAQRSHEPPPSLKSQILAGLAQPTGTRQRGGRAWWAIPLVRTHSIRYVTAFAAGVIAALVFTTVTRQVWKAGDESISGAMGLGAGSQRVVRQHVDLPGESEFTTVRQGERIRASFRLRSHATTHLEVEYEPTQVTLSAVHPPRHDVRVELDRGSVRLSGRGSAETELDFLGPREGPVSMRIVVRGGDDAVEREWQVKLQ